MQLTSQRFGSILKVGGCQAELAVKQKIFNQDQSFRVAKVSCLGAQRILYGQKVRIGKISLGDKDRDLCELLWATLQQKLTAEFMLDFQAILS